MNKQITDKMKTEVAESIKLWIKCNEEVSALKAQGCSNAEISEKLGLPESLVSVMIR